MKHYQIKKAKTGWFEASVERKDGSKESYTNFFTKKEAEIWCYAKVRFYYGRVIADKEF